MRRSRDSLHSEQAPEISEEMRRVIHAAPVPLGCVVKGARRWVEINQRLCDLLGQSPSALLASTVPSGSPLEQCRLTPEGSLLWTQLTFAPCGEAHELVAGCDVTRQRILENDLHDTRAFLESAEAVADMGSWICDLRGEGELHWSANVFRIFGVDEASFDATFESFRRIVHPDDLAAIEEVAQSTIDRDLPFAVDHRVIWPDGQVRWVHERARLIRDGQGAAVRIVGVVQDITERKQAEQKARESEVRLRRLTESRMIGLLYWTRAGFIHDANDYFLELLGYQRSDLELGAMRWTDITPVEYLHLDENALREIADHGYCTPFEKEYIRKDGTRVGVLLGASRLDERGDEGVCFVIDITRRRHLERQLVESQRMDAIGRLAGGVAHDFNNMLAVILGYSSQTLARTGPGDPLRRPLQAIEQAGQHAAKLVRQLLAFGRKQVLSPKVLDLNAVVRKTEVMLTPLLGPQIELVIDLDPRLDPVRCDPAQLEQVIMNLVLNARDAMPEGGRIVLRSGVPDPDERFDEGEPQPEGWAMLTFRDTGHGIPPDVLPRLFEPFFSTKKAGNSGLGLAVVYGILKQSGGHVSVRSDVGQGTTFRVFLPSVRQLAPEERSAGPEPSRPAAVRGWETVLLVEDEPMVRDLARTFLVSHGFNVLTAAHPDEALEIVTHHEEPIHLLLTDVVMPRMNGPAMAERALALRPSMRVLYMSAYANDAVMAHGVEKGARFLQKPFVCEALLGEVRRLLDESTVEG
jgi:PAS domain S-box-containing protein